MATAKQSECNAWLQTVATFRGRVRCKSLNHIIGIEQVSVFLLHIKEVRLMRTYRTVPYTIAYDYGSIIVRYRVNHRGTNAPRSSASRYKQCVDTVLDEPWQKPVPKTRRVESCAQ